MAKTTPETTHTPGPWVVEEIEDKKGDEAFRVKSAYYSDEDVGICGDHSKHWKLLECDARLIAAAPDLLAELRNIAEADPSKWDPEVRDQFREWAQNRARAAIAKAER